MLIKWHFLIFYLVIVAIEDAMILQKSSIYLYKQLCHFLLFSLMDLSHSIIVCPLTFTRVPPLPEATHLHQCRLTVASSDGHCGPERWGVSRGWPERKSREKENLKKTDKRLSEKDMERSWIKGGGWAESEEKRLYPARCWEKMKRITRNGVQCEKRWANRKERLRKKES